MKLFHRSSKVSTSEPPSIAHMRTNLLVGGNAGSGATVALKAMAGRARDEGLRICLISAKESWGNWLTQHAEIAETCMFSSHGNNEEKYVQTLKQVKPGTLDSPLFLVLDNFEYMTARMPHSQSALEQYDGYDYLHQLMQSFPYTYVALRVQRNSDIVSRLSEKTISRLWMGNNSVHNQELFFGSKGVERLPLNAPRGQGILHVEGHDPEIITIPYDPVIQAI